MGPVAGLLGSFFVFAGLLGYQRIGAASTIAILVASQLVAGLIADASASGTADFKTNLLPLIGAVYLLVGAMLILHRSF